VGATPRYQFNVLSVVSSFFQNGLSVRNAALRASAGAAPIFERLAGAIHDLPWRFRKPVLKGKLRGMASPDRGGDKQGH